MFLFQKVIDRSALRQGFQIPVEYHPLLSMLPNGIPVHGETRNIKIILDGKEYDAQLKNQGFDQSKYGGHADVIQIRYGENSKIANRLRQIFHSSWRYVEAVKAKPENVNRKFTIKIPQNQQEFLAISYTDIPNVFVAVVLATLFRWKPEHLYLQWMRLPMKLLNREKTEMQQ